MSVAELPEHLWSKGASVEARHGIEWLPATVLEDGPNGTVVRWEDGSAQRVTIRAWVREPQPPDGAADLRKAAKSDYVGNPTSPLHGELSELREEKKTQVSQRVHEIQRAAVEREAELIEFKRLQQVHDYQLQRQLEQEEIELHTPRRRIGGRNPTPSGYDLTRSMRAAASPSRRAPSSATAPHSPSSRSRGGSRSLSVVNVSSAQTRAAYNHPPPMPQGPDGSRELTDTPAYQVWRGRYLNPSSPSSSGSSSTGAPSAPPRRETPPLENAVATVDNRRARSPAPRAGGQSRSYRRTASVDVVYGRSAKDVLAESGLYSDRGLSALATATVEAAAAMPPRGRHGTPPPQRSSSSGGGGMMPRAASPGFPRPQSPLVGAAPSAPPSAQRKPQAASSPSEGFLSHYARLRNSMPATNSSHASCGNSSSSYRQVSAAPAPRDGEGGLATFIMQSVQGHVARGQQEAAMLAYQRQYQEHVEVQQQQLQMAPPPPPRSPRRPPSPAPGANRTRPRSPGLSEAFSALERVNAAFAHPASSFDPPTQQPSPTASLHNYTARYPPPPPTYSSRGGPSAAFLPNREAANQFVPSVPALVPPPPPPPRRSSPDVHPSALQAPLVAEPAETSANTSVIVPDGNAEDKGGDDQRTVGQAQNFTTNGHNSSGAAATAPPGASSTLGPVLFDPRVVGEHVGGSDEEVDLDDSDEDVDDEDAYDKGVGEPKNQVLNTSDKGSEDKGGEVYAVRDDKGSADIRHESAGTAAPPRISAISAFQGARQDTGGKVPPPPPPALRDSNSSNEDKGSSSEHGDGSQERMNIGVRFAPNEGELPPHVANSKTNTNTSPANSSAIGSSGTSEDKGGCGPGDLVGGSHAVSVDPSAALVAHSHGNSNSGSRSSAGGWAAARPLLHEPSSTSPSGSARMRKATPSPGPNRRHARSEVPNVQSIHRVSPTKEAGKPVVIPNGNGGALGGDDFGDK